MGMDADDARDQFLAAKTTRDVDRLIARLMNNGGCPAYINDDFWKRVEWSNDQHAIQVLVAPTVLAFGSGADVFHASRSTPFGAQAAVDYYDALLPSREIVRHLQKASSPKINLLDMKVAPYDFTVDGKNHGGLAQGKGIETPEACVDASDAANKAFDAAGVSPGDGLVLGYKKSIVVGPGLDGSKVAIYGGLGGPNDAPWNVWQPYSTIHASDYSDYSHGIVLVSRKAFLDGHAVDLRMEVFGSKDPNVYGLVCGSQGRFDPVFPNAGSGSLGKFSVGSTAPVAKKYSDTGGGGGVAVTTGSNGFGTLVKMLGGAAVLYGVVKLLT